MFLKRFLLVAAALAMSAVTAHASSVRFEFTARVDSVSETGDLSRLGSYASGLSAGDTVHGAIQYDLHEYRMVDRHGSGGMTTAHYAMTHFSLTTADDNFELPRGLIFVENDHAHLGDQFRFRATGHMQDASGNRRRLDLQLRDQDHSVSQDQHLLPETIALDEFEVRRLVVDYLAYEERDMTGRRRVQLTLDSIVSVTPVPVPASAVLLLGAVAGMGAVRRLQRRKAA